MDSSVCFTASLGQGGERKREGGEERGIWTVRGEGKGGFKYEPAQDIVCSLRPL